jgi:hypothetical protein
MYTLCDKYISFVTPGFGLRPKKWHMRFVDTTNISEDECWGLQIGGLQHCQENCKWIGISTCEGQNIRLTGYDSRGYRIGQTGIIPEDNDPENNFLSTPS